MANKNPLTYLMCFAVLIVAICGCVDQSARAQSSPALQHVSVRLNFLPGVEHAFLYLGKQKGWYAEQGIDLEVVPGQGSTVAVKTVGSGEDQFAIADTGAVARGWEAGVPLVYVAMLLKHTPAAIFSKPSQNILAMHDLCGKKVGINLRSTTAEQFHAMVRLAKLDCPIEEIPISSGGSKEVLTDAVDAAVNFSYTDALRVKLKAGVNIVPATQFFDFFSLGFITSQKLLADNKDLARRFLSVTFRSLDYSFAHKDEAMEAFFKIVPEADRAYESAKFDMFRELAEDDDADHGVGPQSREAWESTMRSLRDVGLTRSVLSVDGKISDMAIR
jgi:NitT/TauT family transport system substrate-binding protein